MTQILEKHISRWASPNEEILSWIKWDESLDFDQIVIKSEADLKFMRILNADETVFEQKDITHGKAVIDRDMLQIQGFVGFTCIYTLIPEFERRLCFEVDFMKRGELLDTVSLATDLIRPIVVVDGEYDRIMVSDVVRTAPTIKFKLSSKGRAIGVDLLPFIRFTDTQEMTIKIEHVKEKIADASTTLFVLSSEQMVSKFVVNGLGSNEVALGFKYKDVIGNEYESQLVTIPIHLPQREEVKVPITSDLQGQPTIILTPTVS